jgi:hypothetical protein
MDKQENFPIKGISFTSKTKNTVPQGAFKLSSALTAAET